MVLFPKDKEGGSAIMTKKRRTADNALPSTDDSTPVAARTTVHLVQTVRHRKQKLTSRLSDSGFEEDLSSPAPSPVRTVVSPLRPDVPVSLVIRELSNWHQHYGDIGYEIQKLKEAQFHPFKCLARQPQVTAEARCKLVSWLIPVHKHLRLSFECCCLSVNIMDRFLASTPVGADCFQLLGVTALLLASKQVEVFSPRISQLLSLCCDTFTKEQLCNLECLVLLRLNFRLTVPTLAFFLEYYVTSCSSPDGGPVGGETVGGDRSVRDSQVAKRQRQCSNLARRVCELSLADYAFNKYLPSLTACCSLRIASELLRTGHGLKEPTVRSETLECSCKPVRNSLQDQEFVNDQSVSKRSLTAQSVDGHGPPDSGSVAAKGHFLKAVHSHSHSLVQECKENLKLLVSLNQETLEAMLTL